MQLQVQFISYFLPVSSVFHFHTHAFRSLLRVFIAQLTVHVTSVTSHQYAPHHGYNAVAGAVWRRQPSTAHESAPAPDKIDRKGGEGEILWGPYITYGLFQTTGKMCGKVGSDLFRNVDL